MRTLLVIITFKSVVFVDYVIAINLYWQIQFNRFLCDIRWKHMACRTNTLFYLIVDITNFKLIEKKQ